MKIAEMETDRARPAEGRRVSFTRQQRRWALATRCECARDIVGDEPFAVIMPDESCSTRRAY